ncbi:MAG: DUF1282 family protein [Burkholderiales bacterium]|nr:DUF1282 family protein [Burkholderiales bacterium]
MNLSSLTRMPFSPDAAWPELARVGSTVARAFWLLVVPLSLLPPVMIYLAGSHYGDAFVDGFGSKPWGSIAVAFFLCEIISVTLMGWLTRLVVRTWNERISRRDAYVLAAIAAIPLWLSSLGLLVPSLAFNVFVSVVALLVCVGLIFQGVRSFCRISGENIGQAISITQLVFGGGLLAWGLLMLLTFL